MDHSALLNDQPVVSWVPLQQQREGGVTPGSCAHA